VESYCNSSGRELKSGRASRYRGGREKDREPEERGSRKAR